MKLGLAGVLAIAFALNGCGESSPAPTGDGSVNPDGGRLDGSRGDGGVDGSTGDDDASLPPSECGNGMIEFGEECDDDNTAPDDGCDANCAREAHCGDGERNGTEVCDDGNNRSGDGCRSDCASDETCGNDIVDYARGEVCDDEETCDSTCRIQTGCGNGTENAGEQCDDSNTARWDGCSADCREDVAFRVTNLGFAPASEGCDFSGDGMVDNRFSEGLGIAAGALNAALSSPDVPPMLLAMLGLDEVSAANESDLRTAWLGGIAVSGMSNTYAVSSATVGPDGAPLSSAQGSITANALSAGPEDFPIPIGLFPLVLERGRLQATTSGSGASLALENGVLCGGVSVSMLAGVDADMVAEAASTGTFEASFGPPCDGSDSANLADIMVGGAMLGGIFPLGPVTPDVDLDGDGLEAFEVLRQGPSGCQAVITACIDADGTRIGGHDCVLDDRIADGLSGALNFRASRVNLAGVRDPAP